MDEYVNGERVRHSHLYQEAQDNRPQGPVGSENGSLIHDHLSDDVEKHLHPLVEVWEDWDGPAGARVTYYLYGPEVILPKAESRYGT